MSTAGAGRFSTMSGVPHPPSPSLSDLCQGTLGLVSVYALHKSSYRWPPNDPLHSSIHRCNERQAEPNPALLVPCARFAHVLNCLSGQLDRQAHSASSSTIDSWTVSQSATFVSPEVTARARRSISSAHATSSASSDSPTASSRLASKSAASTARSSSVSARASRRIAAKAQCERGLSDRDQGEAASQPG